MLIKFAPHLHEIHIRIDVSEQSTRAGASAQVFALLFATGAAAGFGFTYDVKRYADSVYDSSLQTPALDKLHRDVDRFLKLAYVSAGLMLLATACMALMIMISVYSLVR